MSPPMQRNEPYTRATSVSWCIIMHSKDFSHNIYQRNAFTQILPNSHYAVMALNLMPHPSFVSPTSLPMYSSSIPKLMSTSMPACIRSLY